MKDFDTPPGEVWAFCQTGRDGAGWWYRAGRGRRDGEGRALGEVSLTPFRNFTGDLIICPHGTEPPGAAPDPAFPLLRRAWTIDSQTPAALGLLGCFTRVNSKTGKGYYQGIGTGWFEPGGPAHGKVLLTDGQRLRHVAICPPGVKLPDAAMPVPITVPHRPRRPGEDRPGEEPALHGEPDGGAEEDSED